MKKIILLSLLFTCFISYGQVDSEMKLIDRNGYIEILDSSKVDTTYNPKIIFKDEVSYIETLGISTESGSIKIWFKNYMSGQLTYIILDYRSFNDYSNNDELREALTEMIGLTYGKKFSYDGSDNVIDVSYNLDLNGTISESYHDTIIMDGNNVDSIYTIY